MATRTKSWKRVAGMAGLIVSVLLPVMLLGQQTAGYVLEMQGTTWTAGAQPVKKGQGLAAGTLLSNTKPADGDRLVVTNPAGALLLLAECEKGQCRRCRRSGDCTDEIRPLPNVASTPVSESDHFFEAFKRMLGGEKKYSFARVRGDSLTDSVLRLGPSGCDVVPALADMERGTYGIRFNSIPVQGRAEPAYTSDVLSLNWDPTKTSALVVPGLRPGLYEITLTRREAATDSPAALTAWVLVAEADFAKMSEAFKSAEALTSSWDDAVSQETSQAYLRAHLEYLAGEVQSSGR